MNMMHAELKFKRDGVEVDFTDAPSLPTALKRDALILAEYILSSSAKQSIGCLCKHVLGKVEADVFILRGDRVMVEFYDETSDTRPFAVVMVYTNI